MSNIGKYLLKKRAYAILAALFFSAAMILFLPFYILVAIIIALVTLHKGEKEGLIVLVWALTPVIALTLVLPIHMAALIVLCNYVSIWILASILRRYNSWVPVLEVATGLGVILVLLIGFYFPEIHNLMAISVASFMKSKQQLAEANISPELLREWISVITLLTMGFAVLQLLIFNVLSLLAARGWQAGMFNPGGLALEFKKIRMGRILSIMLLASIVAAIFNIHFVFQILPILLLPYFFEALSLVHCVADKNPNKQVIIAMLYLSCVIFYTVMFLGLSLVGIIDSWYDFRRKVMV